MSLHLLLFERSPVKNVLYIKYLNKKDQLQIQLFIRMD